MAEEYVLFVAVPTNVYAIKHILRFIFILVIYYEGFAVLYRVAGKLIASLAKAVEIYKTEIIFVGPNETHPKGMIPDVFLTPFSPENGATEIWPDSRFTREDNELEYRSIGELAAQTPPLRIEGPAGSVSFRDERAWHRSGENHTDTARLMLQIG